MSAAVLALVASAAYGASDFFAGVLARRLPTVLIALWSQVLGLLVLGTLTALSGQAFAARGFAWGLGAGVIGAVALLVFYRALATGPASVVAPLSAAGVLVPLGVSAVGGDAPGPLALAGIALAIGGLALVAAGNAVDERPETQPCAGPRATTPVMPVTAAATGGRVPVRLALGAALGFGVYFVLLARGTSAASGAELWVVTGVLAGSLPTTAVQAHRERQPLRLEAVLAPILVVALADLAGDGLLTYATADGDLGVVSVLGSLDPVVTVLLAVVLLHERVSARQGLGVAACLSGVVLVGAGG